MDIFNCFKFDITAKSVLPKNKKIYLISLKYSAVSYLYVLCTNINLIINFFSDLRIIFRN
jgi:hypothetical protein